MSRVRHNIKKTAYWLFIRLTILFQDWFPLQPYPVLQDDNVATISPSTITAVAMILTAVTKLIFFIIN
jgi:hypothetical protein